MQISASPFQWHLLSLKPESIQPNASVESLLKNSTNPLLKRAETGPQKEIPAKANELAKKPSEFWPAFQLLGPSESNQIKQPVMPSVLIIGTYTESVGWPGSKSSRPET